MPSNSCFANSYWLLYSLATTSSSPLSVLWIFIAHSYSPGFYEWAHLLTASFSGYWAMLGFLYFVSHILGRDALMRSGQFLPTATSFLFLLEQLHMQFCCCWCLQLFFYSDFSSIFLMIMRPSFFDGPGLSMIGSCCGDFQHSIGHIHWEATISPFDMPSKSSGWGPQSAWSWSRDPEAFVNNILIVTAKSWDPIQQWPSST